MKLAKIVVTTLLLTSLLGCVGKPGDATLTLLQDPQVQAMVAEHPTAGKKVFREVTRLERELREAQLKR